MKDACNRGAQIDDPGPHSGKTAEQHAEEHGYLGIADWLRERGVHPSPSSHARPIREGNPKGVVPQRQLSPALRLISTESLVPPPNLVSASQSYPVAPPDYPVASDDLVPASQSYPIAPPLPRRKITSSGRVLTEQEQANFDLRKAAATGDFS
ncbi:MAG: hypothetical protein LBJ81_02045, partial [Puniceicoccales bacterium]|nr:hypothetical protein [Puniceicoccales bacterium]